jgi:hypothetical protein
MSSITSFRCALVGRMHQKNMQWQELAASKVKDKEEWHTCRLLKKHSSLLSVN